MSAQVTITQLPTAGPITGTELVPIVQNGQTVQTTTAAISASPSQTQTFLTINQEPTLPNSQYLSAGSGLTLNSGGPLSYYRIELTGTLASLDSAATGIIVKNSSSTVAARSIAVSGAGLSVSDADGTSGNPTLALSGAPASLANLGGTGMLAVLGGTTVTGVNIVGVAGQTTVLNGNGSGNPTIGLDITGVTPGTYGSGTQVAQIAVDSTGRVTSATNITISGATNIFGGTNNQLLYQTAPGTTGFAVAPTVTDTFLKWNGSSFVWDAVAGAGTVTSVDVSGGTTGLTTSGGPIIAAGTITLGGTLVVANGGTGATSLTGYVKGNGTSAMTASATVPVGDITGTLPVGNGGTGATTLTGYVKGNGTSAMTASATIPNTDITGLGSMSTQSASSVAITGGAIDGTTIGGSTPAAGTFTSVAMTTGTISTLPASGNDIVNRTYADSIAAGINFHQSVKYATTAALPAVTYANGTGGVGATLTANANGALTIDGYTFTSPADDGTRILVKNQASQLQNGVYTLTQAGDAGNPFILTRATDFDSAGSGVDQIDAGDFFLVTAGTANANTSWVQQTPLPITVGTTAIVFAQFGAPIVYSAGTGLSESPSYTFNIANTTVAAGSYGGAATAMTLAINAQGQITSATDVSIAIAASQITSGQLAIAYGGTNATATPTAGAVAYGTGSAYAFTSAGNSGDVLTSSGSGAPTWTTATNSNTASTIVQRDASGNFSAGTITAALNGNASTASSATNATNTAITVDTTNADYYITVVSANTGDLPQLVATGLTANPSTGKITAGIAGGTF